MRRKSSLSVEDIWPEYRERIEALEDIARFIVQSNPNVRRVLLFGSMARGTAGRRSDADVAIILKEDHRRPPDRIPEFLRYFIEAPMPVDVLVYT
ncbi:MAG TPA: nucleotidyltransferase domain-containing protein, partial [Chloroflexi bacterium]|nr:nucleotidyltransferase domain-containing protein [Chloroflexota bacterium]